MTFFDVEYFYVFYIIFNPWVLQSLSSLFPETMPDRPSYSSLTPLGTHSRIKPVATSPCCDLLGQQK